MITFDIPLPAILTLLASTIFPTLVGLVTKRTTSPGVKAILLAALALVAQLATELAEALRDGTSYNLGMALILGLASFIIAVAMHYGLWKPTGVAVKAQEAFSGPQTVGAAEPPADRVPGPDHKAGGP